MNISNLITSALQANILTITLNRPEVHNAFNEELILSLTQALKDAEQNDNIRLIILKANGKSFCAGADLNWMRKVAHYSYAENIADAKLLSDLMQALYNFSKPTIALVQGPVYGGGIGLLACCDVVIASEDATFCLSETRLGLVPAIISPYLVCAIGERNARYYGLTAEVFNAERAREMNLIHILSSRETLQQTANDVAATLLRNSPAAMRATKQLLHEYNKPIINEEIIMQTLACIATARISHDGQRGISAFLQKQRIEW